MEKATTSNLWTLFCFLFLFFFVCVCISHLYFILLNLMLLFVILRWAIVPGKSAEKDLHFLCACRCLCSLLLPFSKIVVLFTDVKKNGRETAAIKGLSLFSLQLQVSFKMVGLEERNIFQFIFLTVSLYLFLSLISLILQIFGLGWVSVSCWLKLRLLPCISLKGRKCQKCKWNFYFA